MNLKVLRYIFKEKILLIQLEINVNPPEGIFAGTLATSSTLLPTSIFLF